MNREQGEKLLAALIFDDLDEASKAELLTYLQTDDELRERLADMRMAAKVASDTLQHGPDPVLGKRRLKSLVRLAGRRQPRPTIFTLPRLAAAAAVIAVVLLPVLFILPGSSRVRLYSRDVAFRGEYRGRSPGVSSQGIPPSSVGIGSGSKWAYDPVDETRQYSMQTETRNSSPSVGETGETRKYSLLPPVTNGPLISEGYYYTKNDADEIAGIEISLSGDDNLYTMGEVDKIGGGELSVPGGDPSGSRSWRGSVSHDDYLASASVSEPSSATDIGGGGGMMGGYGGMGRYGGGGYGYAMATGTKRANEIESFDGLWRHQEDMDEGAPPIAKPEYGRSVRWYDSGTVPGAVALSGNNSETLALYND